MDFKDPSDRVDRIALRPLNLSKAMPSFSSQNSSTKIRSSSSNHNTKGSSATHVFQDEPDLLQDEADEEEAVLLPRSRHDMFPSNRKRSETKLKPSRKYSSSQSRIVPFNVPDKNRVKYPANVVRNQKYNVITFFPIVLYEQFKFFFNLYFLLVALSQFIPALRIGFLATYVVPLAFVLMVTMGKEAYDDWNRYKRDVVANSARYTIIDPKSPAAQTSNHLSTNHEDPPPPATKSISSLKLKVGDLVVIEKNQRVPADCVLLKTSDESGTCFVRTDQLDGETDWKLRVSVKATQPLSHLQLLNLEAEIEADPPNKDIHTFVGTYRDTSFDDNSDSPVSPNEDIQYSQAYALTAENVLWANTILAAGQAVGFVIYTGRDTRAVMNTSHPSTKIGLLETEINNLSKILCLVTLVLSILLVALNGFRGQWYIYVFRFLILFSSIIPISLRVNLDMGKSVYSHQIETDKEIPNTVVRTSPLLEELGRIEFLLSDKTGTLTQNEMQLRKLHLGTISYGMESMDEVAGHLKTAFSNDQYQENKDGKDRVLSATMLPARGRRDISTRLRDVALALALCHNITPVHNDDDTITYQASSPDEVAIILWTDSVGLSLTFRDRTMMRLRSPSGDILEYDILDIFPFTSDSKRMGIIVKDRATNEIMFYQKGADVVMAPMVKFNDWLEEECGNMAREGLRTLVVTRKRIPNETWELFRKDYHEASISSDRTNAMAQVVAGHLEHDLEVLGITGVEDKLQDDVKMTIELLRNAGLHIWVLTGDKVETATCIAISTKLVARGQYIHQMVKLCTPAEAKAELEFLQSKADCCLVIDGQSLALCLEHFCSEFVEVATKLPSVVACRCSPTQKADITRLIRNFTKKRVCCIGDGGNDVSMIQAADVGVGIVGKEGKQASLAADFSITQFSHITKLLLWHGRNSYKRSAKLAQFVIHRGFIISVLQAVFSSVFYYAPIAIFQGWLMVGYSTFFTMAPVFSLVIDTDVSEELALLYPELYLELVKGRTLSYKTFFVWLMVSVYQGGAIMILSLVLFENELINVIAISFTSLIFVELIMVGLYISTWHLYNVLAEMVTLLIYLVSMALLPEYFDLRFVFSIPFAWRVAVIVAISTFPLYIFQLIKNRLAPSSYSKLRAQ